MTVAEIILQQLGGNRFIAMTGSYHFVGDRNSLTMTLRRNKSKANRLKITLTAMDDYTIEFFRQTDAHFTKNYEWKEGTRTTVKKLDGIYYDQLEEIFENVTGLVTHL